MPRVALERPGAWDCSKCGRLLFRLPRVDSSAEGRFAPWYVGDLMLLFCLAIVLAAGAAVCTDWQAGAKAMALWSLASIGLVSLGEGVSALQTRVGRLMRKTVRGRKAKALGAVQVGVGVLLVVAPAAVVLLR
jgi:hypothetical protein